MQRGTFKPDDLHVLLIDDEVMKAQDIKKALKFNKISRITYVTDQEQAWKELENEDNHFDLIVTDMYYPLNGGEKPVDNAGLILLEELKKKGICIPVIICSSANVVTPDALGTVWYSPLRDLDDEFGRVLRNLK